MWREGGWVGVEGGVDGWVESGMRTGEAERKRIGCCWLGEGGFVMIPVTFTSDGSPFFHYGLGKSRMNSAWRSALGAQERQGGSQLSLWYSISWKSLNKRASVSALLPGARPSLAAIIWI